MMYRDIPEPVRKVNKHGSMPLIGFAVLIVGVAIVISAFYMHGGKSGSVNGLSNKDVQMVSRTRLLRTAIPKVNISGIRYTSTFNDLNDIQLEAAIRNGISTPGCVDDPAKCSELVPIASNQLYAVEDMSHSMPYLVPDAALLLEYIGLRFHEILDETHPNHHYRFIVTSALRSRDNVRHLQGRNANATTNSCHCYGTTIDISYVRFLDANDNVVKDLFLKEALAKALYELRYEGLCYVKYEVKQACFHLTVRKTEYVGDGDSETCQYAVPLSTTVSDKKKDRSRKHDAAKRREMKNVETQKDAKRVKRGMEL